MSLAWYDWIGTIGVVMILIAYLLLQVERINPNAIPYSAVNLIGSGLIAVSLVYEFNFSAFVIEVCWMAISVIGIGRTLWHRRQAPVEAPLG